MRIGIDGRPLCDNPAGIYRFLANVFRELQRLDETNEYYIYAEHDFALPLPSPRWQRRILCHQPPRFSNRWGQIGMKHMIVQDGLDAFWGTFGLFPMGIPSSVARVLTIYDLVWLRYPRTMGFRNYLAHRLLTGRSAVRADKIITISESTSTDLQHALGVRQEKVCVVYPAPEARYCPREQAEAARYIANKYQTRENYICAVGTVEPRKNLLTLLEAVKVVKNRDLSVQLLVAGAPGWKNSGIYEAVKQLRLSECEVKFLGYVPDDDMPAFYCGARVFVFPSLYEGFGIPLVEAMACGVPIVASNVSSIPEVVQDAALLVSPRHPEEFAEAISRVSGDSSLRTSMILKGLRRASDFSWESAARKILNLLVGLSPPKVQADSCQDASAVV